jgi:hypothetical protein
MSTLFVEHGGEEKALFYLSNTGAQTLIRAGKAKGYYNPSRSPYYYVRFNKRNNAHIIISILLSYGTPIP